MSKLKELLEKREQVAAEAKDLMEQSGADGITEERAADLESQADKAFESYDDLTKKIDREEKLERMQQAEAERRERVDEGRRPGQGQREAENTNSDEPNYRNAFAEYVRCQGQVGAMRPEYRTVLEAGYSTIPAGEQRAQTTANAAGGYTVPEEMMAILVERMEATGPMYNPGITFEMQTTGGNPMPIPTVDDTGVTAGASGGQGVTLTDDGGKDVTFGERTLDAFSYDTEFLRISKELADDSMLNMESVIGRLLGKRLGKIANEKLTIGSGSGEPNGIVTAAGAGVTAASTTAVTFDELIDLEHSVDPEYRVATALYMLNDNSLKAVRKLKDGDGNYLWQAGDVKKGIPATLNGYEYAVNQAMVNMAASSRSIVFGDFSQYFVRKVGAPLVGAIQDKDFWPGFGMAGWIRFDGELADTNAVKAMVQAAS